MDYYSFTNIGHSHWKSFQSWCRKSKQNGHLQAPVRQNRSPMCALPMACHEAWLKRPFHFSAGLDSWVANAVLSLAIMEFQGRHGRNPSTLLDPCCGSGTLAAMAAASGIFSQVFARDVDEPFLQRATENFAHFSTHAPLSALDVGVHDAATPFNLPQPDIVIANPPWGWRIGLARTASTEEILANLLHQFPSAIVAVICPELPTQLGQFQVRSSCALGQSAVWILIPGENQREKVTASHANVGAAMLATVALNYGFVSACWLTQMNTHEGY